MVLKIRLTQVAAKVMYVTILDIVLLVLRILAMQLVLCGKRQFATVITFVDQESLVIRAIIALLITAALHTPTMLRVAP